MPIPKEIIIFSVIIVVSFFSIYKSLTFLRSKSDVSSYYGFYPFIPVSGSWSILLYFIIIFTLMTFTFILIKNTGVVFPPA